MVFVVYQTLYNVYNIVQSMHECGYDTPYHDDSNNMNNRDVECNYSPRFAWGGRPHRRFISVRERG